MSCYSYTLGNSRCRVLYAFDFWIAMVFRTDWVFLSYGSGLFFTLIDGSSIFWTTILNFLWDKPHFFEWFFLHPSVFSLSPENKSSGTFWVPALFIGTFWVAKLCSPLYSVQSGLFFTWRHYILYPFCPTVKILRSFRWSLYLLTGTFRVMNRGFFPLLHLSCTWQFRISYILGSCLFLSVHFG